MPSLTGLANCVHELQLEALVNSLGATIVNRVFSD